MTPELSLILAVGFIISVDALTAIVDRFQHRNDPETGDDCRQIDVLKRGEIIPWHRDF